MDLEDGVGPGEDRPEGLDRESIVLLVLLMAAGLVPTVVAVAHGDTFGADEAIGLMLVALGALGIAREIFAAARRARAIHAHHGRRHRVSTSESGRHDEPAR